MHRHHWCFEVQKMDYKKLFTYLLILSLVGILVWATIAIISPTESTINKGVSQTFVCNLTVANASIEKPYNFTIYSNRNGGRWEVESYNTTMPALSSTANISSLTITNISNVNTNITWACAWNLQVFNRTDPTQNLAGSLNYSSNRSLYIYRTDVPEVSGVGPSNGAEFYNGGVYDSVTSTVNITWSCSVATGVHARNCTVWHNLSGTWAPNLTHAQTAGQASWTALVSQIYSGDKWFIWNIEGCSDRGNCTFAFTDYNRTVYINTSLKPVGNPPTLNTVSPENATRYYTTSVTISGYATDDVAIRNVSLYIGTSGGLVGGANATNTTVITGNNTVKFDFALTLGAGTYQWWLTARDGHNLTTKETNLTKREFIIDQTSPNFTLMVNRTALSRCEAWNFTVRTGEASTLNVSAQSTASGASAQPIVFSSTFATEHSVLVPNLLADTTYNYNLTVCDAGQNCNQNISSSFVFHKKLCTGWSSYAVMGTNVTLQHISNLSDNSLTSVCTFNNTKKSKNWICYNAGAAANAAYIIRRGEAWYGYTGSNGSIDLSKEMQANTTRTNISLWQGWNLVGETEGRSFYNISWQSMNGSFAHPSFYTNLTSSAQLGGPGFTDGQHQKVFTFYNNSRQGRYVNHPFNFTLGNITSIPQGWSFWMFINTNTSWVAERNALDYRNGTIGAAG